MLRFTAVVGTALLLAVVASPGAAADARTLHGEVEPRGKVRVKVDRYERGGEVLPRFRVRFIGVPLHCGAGETATTNVRTTLYRFGSDRDVDATVVTVGVGDEYRSKLSVRMRIDGNRRVEGTVRYVDRQFETAPGITEECDTGRLPWTAQERAGP